MCPHPHRVPEQSNFFVDSDAYWALREPEEAPRRRWREGRVAIVVAAAVAGVGAAGWLAALLWFRA